MKLRGRRHISFDVKENEAVRNVLKRLLKHYYHCLFEQTIHFKDETSVQYMNDFFLFYAITLTMFNSTQVK